MDVEACRSGEKGPDAVSGFHRRLRGRPADAFLVIRALALSLGPDVQERVKDAFVCYARGDQPFLTVESRRARLHLAFPPRVRLNDPMGRLLKHGEDRYVPVEGPESFDGHVQDFVRRSYTESRVNARASEAG